jgi:hypothetical protein
MGCLSCAVKKKKFMRVWDGWALKVFHWHISISFLTFQPAKTQRYNTSTNASMGLQSKNFDCSCMLLR